MMPIFMFASYGFIAEATGGSRKPMSASSGADYPARQYMGLNFYREDPHSPHMNLKPARVGGSGDGAGKTAPHEFCSTSFASERVPASERCTLGANNRNQNFHLRTGLTRRRLWSLLTQTVTMAEPNPTWMTSHKRLPIAGCGARIRTGGPGGCSRSSGAPVRKSQTTGSAPARPYSR